MITFINRLFYVIILMTLLAACVPANLPTPASTSAQIENSYAAQLGDGTMVRDTVQIVKTEMVIRKSNPPQFILTISFFTPTPCHQFRATVDQPGADNRFNIEVYSLMKKDQVCTLMRLNTPTEAKLSLSNLSTGHYTVWINGEKALEFDA